MTWEQSGLPHLTNGLVSETHCTVAGGGRGESGGDFTVVDVDGA